MTNNKLKLNQNLLNNLLSLYQNKDYANAENLALSITQQHPNHKHAWKILAAVFEQTNRNQEALKANQNALKIDPNDPEIYLCLGNNFYLQDKLDDAEFNFKKAIDLNPNYLQALYNLGLILKKKQRFTDAVSFFERVIKLKPDFLNGYYSLGLTLIDLGELNNALINLKKVIDLKPQYPQAFFNLGIVLRKLGKKKEALKNFQQSINLKPDYKKAYNLIGVTLAELGRYDEALENFQLAINLDSKYAEVYNNLGNILKELGRFQESYHYFQKAIDLKPDYADAYNNLGRALMLNFDFQKAFELMEWRLRREEKNFIPLNTSKPRWDGLTKHRVFVWREQGIGDWIMFSSMIPELHASVEKVIVECDPRVIPLFQRSFSEEIQFITDRTEISEDDYDSHLPIGSLPFHFRKELDDFKKSSQGWLQADIERFQCIKEKISQNKSKKIVGISWNTKSSLTQAFQRNIKLEDLLLPLKDLDFIFVNLQYGDVSEEINNLKVNHGIDVLEIPDLDIFNDIDGLSAIIAACDSVISIDNLNPHLAGALNIRTKLLLPYAADDRWGHKTSKSYWYDSITIHRQAEPGNWKQPLFELASDLSSD
ncbi:tetratricopeptide repeat protein [Alphaproteobacteria bacterium]|nr:tetratricopeptide repeat protein [Alphaproteobacteria bacterium]